MDVKNNQNEITDQVKQDVVAAYNEVLRKLKETSAGQEQIRQEEQIAHEKSPAIEAIVKEPSEELADHLAILKHSLTKTLDNLQERLLPEYEKFFTVRKAIEYSEAELKELHHIKVSAGALTALTQAHKEKMVSYENELVQCRQAFAQEKLKMANELEQEEADYVIKRDAIRKLDHEKYESSKLEVEKALAEKRAAFEEDFISREARIASREKEHQLLKDREAWIIAREQEYHELKEKAAYHAEELRLVVQKAERATADKLTSKYEYEAKLMRIEIESDRKMYQQKIGGLEEQIERYKSLKQLFKETPALTEETTFSNQHTANVPSLMSARKSTAEEVSAD